MASQEQIEECFKVLDKEKKGFLTKEQIPLAIRALGKNPTETEMKALLNEVKEKADLSEFKTLYRNCKGKSPQDQDREMRNAFQALDSGSTGFIHEAELRQILANLGDALNSQEVNALMREAKANEKGLIEYNEFVSLLVNSYPVGDKLGNKR
eukprot:TRINITY_DN13367_c0_g1_i1.p1 TRINITY_DN13367_c0_g1~~TRINITY_DN13367_c0_g1_i1.p1  ORF type:complete len:153 (-),score=55.46 TRINITY_DN13367_c0_g1_i1:104-562(-)